MLALTEKSSLELMLALGEVICRPFILLTKSWWQLKMPGVCGSTDTIFYLEDTGS